VRAERPHNCGDLFAYLELRQWRRFVQFAATPIALGLLVIHEVCASAIAVFHDTRQPALARFVQGTYPRVSSGHQHSGIRGDVR